MVHQRIPVENCVLILLDHIQIMISQSSAIPQDVTVPRLLEQLLKPVFGDHILQRIQLVLAVAQIYFDVFVSSKSFCQLI